MRSLWKFSYLWSDIWAINKLIKFSEGADRSCKYGTEMEQVAEVFQQRWDFPVQKREIKQNKQCVH